MRLYTADAIKEQVHKLLCQDCGETDYCPKCDYRELIDQILDAPTVDAVEVVRCQDCESWGLNAIKKDEKGDVIYGDCLHFCVGTPKWFYCAWGERKNGQ